MSTPNTLLELLTEYKIVIPRVQRDYVQGRMDEHSTIVRKNLLRDIKNAYEGIIAPLDLNFVYGKTTVDKTFYPVDGQQRLTTLYLLHIYAFFDDGTKSELLERFSYQARTTTDDFFIELVINRADIFDSKESPEIIIRDAPWFIDSWKYDPSINNALTTLNDIVRLGFDRSRLKMQLEEKKNPKVFFHFVKLDELGMEDELYIKLNARGRALTAFENFKSRFIDRCMAANPILSEEIKKNLDGIWADLIWEIGKIGKEGFDDFYLRFFETVFLNHGLIKTETNRKLSENWIYSFDYSLITAEIFSGIKNTLNYLQQNKDGDAYKIIIDAIKKESPYPEKVLFHAVFMYLRNELVPGNINNELFYDWLRVFIHLVDNSRIEEADVYSRAINSINDLSINKNSLLKFLASGVKPDLPGFLKEQFEEECQKARIICKDSLHKQAIIYAENILPYFSGQIRSVLYFSDVEKKDNLTLFYEYAEKLSVLFEKKKPVDGKLLRRALCAIGDYRLTVGNYKTLCIDDPNESSRTWSLKKLFSDHGNEVQSVLDSIGPLKPIKPQLQEIIDKNKIPQKDWRYCIVNYGDSLFQFMSPSHLRMVRNSKEELLVPNKQSNGENYSVYLFVIKILLEKDGISSEYYAEKGAWGKRNLKVGNCIVTYSNGCFFIEDNGHQWVSKREDIINEAIEYIKSIVL